MCSQFKIYMSLMIKVSVLIPSFNRASTLSRALDSVLAQTQSAAEIIVIDDGSTDNTQELIQQKYPQVVYLYQDNKGVSAARNLGIKQSKGDWLAFLDSDDAWLDSKLKIQCEALLKEPEFKICHTEEIWIRNGTRVNQMKKHQKFGGEIFQKCLPLCVISPSSVLIEKNILEQVGLFDESYQACEDYELWLRLCAFLPVLFIESPQIYKVGGHEDQLSRKFWGMDRFRVAAIDKTIRHSTLSKNNKLAAIAMLLSKVDILQKGAKKHGNTELLDYCNRLLALYLP
ncbi:Putative N-acetylgalactosaminyl-diphosphoundecaprenol glucuronosyltransferase [hydrothermal vent metagenome]|uniref:N-acetylgalactosaminyl-diphosphoundecaprenol glucuronosyltransferase n=1 Tax=hydrothermal vent metagenome TaxID=652676 RepID=A0A3B0Y772_9ZZZZ